MSFLTASFAFRHEKMNPEEPLAVALHLPNKVLDFKRGEEKQNKTKVLFTCGWTVLLARGRMSQGRKLTTLELCAFEREPYHRVTISWHVISNPAARALDHVN